MGGVVPLKQRNRTETGKKEKPRGEKQMGAGGWGGGGGGAEWRGGTHTHAHTHIPYRSVLRYQVLLALFALSVLGLGAVHGDIIRVTSLLQQLLERVQVIRLEEERDGGERKREMRERDIEKDGK